MVAKNDVQVRRFRRKSGHLFPTSCRIVLAVSGGADSMALLHLFMASQLVTRDSLLVAHFDHGLRPESADDAQFVMAEANKYGVSGEVEVWRRHSPESYADGLEASARQARYDFLRRCSDHFGATFIVTGHHRDDQAETFLERLLRGSGVRGLGAMANKRVLTESTESVVELVRPLLFLSRIEIRRWMVRHGLSWREDASNSQLLARRNRIRHELLPALQAIADGDVSVQLVATAERMAQADASLQWMLLQLWPTWDPQRLAVDKLSLSALALMPLPDELLCRCVHHCHRQLTEDWRPPGSRAVAGFVYLLRTRRRRWSMVMRGLVVYRQHERIVFHAAGAASAQSPQAIS